MNYGERMLMTRGGDEETGSVWKSLLKVTSVIVPIAAVSLVPWCVWVTQSIFKIELKEATIQTWMDQGPRFTSTDAEALRLKVLNDSRSLIDAKFVTLENKIDTVATSVQRLELLVLQNKIDASKQNAPKP